MCRCNRGCITPRQTLIHIPEVITGLGGAGLIGIALFSSIRWNRANSQV
jgi:hypothetical protein